MSFGLKNAGATYQRLVNTMFEHLIGHNMEVYIDDMLVKSTQASNHLKDLGECFGILRKYRMKLNLDKCTFGVRGGKFLGYMVSERGIEANPEKIKTILNMNPPKSVKGILELTGHLTTLNQFISRSVYKGLPFFKLLRSGKARKLRPYFQSYLIIVLTNHPLKQIISSPKASGRMVKWAIKLRQYGIEYRPRPAIKAQILADFLVDTTVTQEESSTPTWMVYVDGSSTSTVSGAGIVVESPQGDKFQYAIKFLFPVTNNEVEYEAFIMGIKLALSVGAKKVTIHSDSQLIVSQVNGKYEAKKDKMLGYLTQVNELLSCLDNYDVKQIPRMENESADRLAKLASSLANIDNRKITLLTYGKEETDGSDVTIFCADSEEPSWKDEIIDYLRQGNLPSNQVEARKLRVRAAWLTIIDGEL
ncbi:uncharacterized protein [Henckelia pumila]|uniref:uncharacterized protein n=1 Tax=Henckelia pumila TaxID=405737 RepID=UPI003C6E314E